jgi:glycogenin glucosyltransferase
MSAYVTLLSGEVYLPGVITLGYQLRQLKVKYDLVILVNVESICKQSLDLINSIYDKVISIQLINSDVQFLQKVLARPELCLTYSKILLWNQPYEKLVYLDADTLPLKNLDHLFDIQFNQYEIVASCDAGWPDIFNTGVFILKPNKLIFEKLIKFTENFPSFDGADQGLLNEFFNIQNNNWIKLPFLFNVTPNFNQSYQYLPAFNRFFHDIQILHFIGQNKPWFANSILDCDTSNFHHLWWAQFNKLDDSIKSKLLASKKPQASKLTFPKLTNTWDISNDSAPNKPDDSIPIPSIFPWESRGINKPTRVFDTHGNPEYIGQAKLDDKLNENIQKLNLKTKTKKSSFSNDTSFNPTKSLEEVAKIPLRFLSKQKEQDDDEGKEEEKK